MENIYFGKKFYFTKVSILPEPEEGEESEEASRGEDPSGEDEASRGANPVGEDEASRGANPVGDASSSQIGRAHV